MGGYSLQSSALDLYLFDDMKLRDMVYKEIKTELKYVLGELKWFFLEKSFYYSYENYALGVFLWMNLNFYKLWFKH